MEVFKKEEEAYEVVIDALNYRRRTLANYLNSELLPEEHRKELEEKMAKLKEISSAFF